MMDLSRYRIIDLSYELVPAERKIYGTYQHGEPFYGRGVEVQEFIAFGARMHHIQNETHNGTHVEAPYKYSETGADPASMPLETYLGEAAACDFTNKSAGEPITPDDLAGVGVRTGDIVLAWGSERHADDPPYLTSEAVDWLINTRIKAIGINDLRHSPPGTPFGLEDSDARLLLAGVGYIDALLDLSRITRPRVFFIGLPVKIQRVTAAWTRAIVLEEIAS
jgi:kynurenine formamidase